MPADAGDDGDSGGTREPTETVDADDRGQRDPGPDEVYCMSCGAIIKERAEICPECGVRQEVADGPGGTEQAAAEHQQQAPAQSQGEYAISEHRRHELEKVANKDTTAAVLVGFLLSPVAYLMVGRVGLAIVNFLTFNYFLLGPIIVPIHCMKIIQDAEKELRRAGVEGY